MRQITMPVILQTLTIIQNTKLFTFLPETNLNHLLVSFSLLLGAFFPKVSLWIRPETPALHLLAFLLICNLNLNLKISFLEHFASDCVPFYSNVVLYFQVRSVMSFLEELLFKYKLYRANLEQCFEALGNMLHKVQILPNECETVVFGKVWLVPYSKSFLWVTQRHCIY